MKMQKLFESWNTFKSDLLIENILNEVSYEFSEHVEDWLANNGGELSLPFNDLFDGKTRTVVPLGRTIQPGSKIYRLIKWLEEQGYEVDFGSGLATKEFESFTGNPNDPNTKKIMRKKQQKIGKVLLTIDHMMDPEGPAVRQFLEEFKEGGKTGEGQKKSNEGL